MRTARRKNNGFTLVEVMVAMLILFISMMALLWAMAMAVDHNFKNLMQNEAVKLVEEQTETLRGTVFADLASGSKVIYRNFKNTSIQYKMNWTVENLSTSNSRAIRITAEWSWKGISHQHSVASIVSVGL